MQSYKFIKELLALADIKVSGDRPWDIKIHDECLFKRILSQGSLGLGEAYMDHWWDCEKLDEFFHKILSAKLEERFRFSLPSVLLFIKAFIFNSQSLSGAFRIGEHHYDIGNDLYRVMLDERLTYTCGYWEKAANLNEAQEAKLDLVCRKIGLKSGDKVLDIGCGWGSFAKFAAEKYGAEVVGITVSKEQAALGKELCKNLPIEFRLQDYRNINDPLSHEASKGQRKFDHVVSLGMFEHVGVKNHRTYMEVAARCLKDDGLFLLHTIGSNRSVYSTDPWINRYIFPNGMLPSIAQIGKSVEGLFVMEDWHNFGADYDKTLMAWFENFDKGWSSLKDKYSDRFYRMWKYYLLSCAGSFRARRNQLWQIVLSKKGILGGYETIR